MIKHIKKTLLLVLLIALLIGIVNATDTTNQTTDTQNIIKNTDTTHTQITKEITDNIKQDTNKKAKTKSTVSTTNGTIGEKLDLTAKVTSNNKPVNNGYVIFKLNGITLKDNKKLTDSNNPLKVYVKDGIANTTVIADLNMRHAQNFTAVYSGSSSYEASRSNIAKANILLKNASLIVSTNTKNTKQGQNITLKAQVYDITNNKTNQLTNYEDEYVYFKINGLTLKNKTNEVLKVKVVNGVATTIYTVPLGLSGVVDAKTMTPKNHTVFAGYANKNYYPTAQNTSTFQVERSNININIENVIIDNKKHQLSLNASIKDYLGNFVSGPNKCIIKINGVSIKNGTQPMYYYATNGVLKIQNTQIPAQEKYTSLEIVTQDRLAYKSQRNSTTRFNIIKQDTQITLNPIAKIDYNKDVTLSGKITGKSNEVLHNKTLTVNFNGQTRKITTDNNGNFKYTNKTNQLGTNTITVTFDGDTYFSKSTNKTTFTVIHKPTIIEFTATDVTYDDYTQIEGYLKDCEYNNLIKTRVILTINGETYYTRTNEYGEFNYNYITKKAGKNNITARFNGTEYYNPVTKTKSFNVYKKESEVYLDSFPETVSLGDYVPISGGVIDNNNNILRNVNITIKVNNERFNLKTDNYGYYSYDYKTNKVGTNTVEVTVIGNENYEISTTSNRFNVLQTYNMTLNFYKDNSDEKIVYSDRFSTLYQSTDGQRPQGAYVIVEDIYQGIEGQASNLLLNATFYFKNSKGNIISRQFTDYFEEVLSHELISGYTPLKVTVTYRKKTDDERSLWYDGYRYNPFAKEWEQTYEPYDYVDGET